MRCGSLKAAVWREREKEDLINILVKKAKHKT